MHNNLRFSAITSLIVRNPFLKHWFYYLLAGFGLLAALMMVYDMQWGPWAFSDSAAYISAARNLAAGNGLSVPTPDGGLEPLTLHQPLYPLLMALFLKLGAHPFTSTRLMNIVCFGASVFILSAGGYYFSRSKALALAAAALMTCSPHVIENYDGAMSEPLYLTLTLLVFMSVQLYLRLGKRWVLVAGALFADLSILTRYIGVVNVGSAALMLLLLLQTKPVKRLWDALLFTLIAAIPAVVCLLLNPLASGVGNRQVIFPANFLRLVRSFWREWVVPLADWLPLDKQWQVTDEFRFTLVGVLILVILVGLAFGVWMLIRRKTSFEPLFRSLVFGAAIQTLVYVSMLFAAYAFSSLPPDINSRTIIPIFPFLILIVFGMLILFPQTHFEKVLAGLILAGAFILSLTVWYPISRELLYDRRHNGHGYTSRYYQESTVLKAARNLPKDVPWISNEPAFFLLYLDKFPHDLSVIYPEISQPDNPAFGQGATKLDMIFREENAYLLLLQPQLEREIRKIVGDQAPGQIENFTKGLPVVDDSFDGMILQSGE